MRLSVIGMIGVMIAFGFLVAYVDYRGRYDNVLNERAGCEKGKRDRAAIAAGLRLDQQVAHRLGAHDLVISYGFTARKLEESADRDCGRLFPTPNIITFG